MMLADAVRATLRAEARSLDERRTQMENQREAARAEREVLEGRIGGFSAQIESLERSRLEMLAAIELLDSLDGQDRPSAGSVVVPAEGSSSS